MVETSYKATWDDVNNKPIERDKNYRYTTDFNSNGFVTKDKYEGYDSDTEEFILSEEITYSYDGKNRVTEGLTIRYHDGEAIAFDKDVFTYDDASKTATCISYYKSSEAGEYAENTKTEYKLNKYGMIDHSNSKSYKTKAFENKPYNEQYAERDAKGNETLNYSKSESCYFNGTSDVCDTYIHYIKTTYLYY